MCLWLLSSHRNASNLGNPHVVAGRDAFLPAHSTSSGCWCAFDRATLDLMSTRETQPSVLDPVPSLAQFAREVSGPWRISRAPARLAGRETPSLAPSTPGLRHARWMSGQRSLGRRVARGHAMASSSHARSVCSFAFSHGFVVHATPALFASRRRRMACWAGN